ncbi:MAG: DUF1801 domain-containing protein [Candidatus Marinimicrobia bacterium]|nr:DUF1801 domain-containing protein [Candidatus Neomarinimicrobiota bacterium]
MQSKATSIDAYLNSLPADRAEQITRVRATILDHLPEGYEETMNWGMITYQVPLSVYPDTYNKQPLMYAALASQKNHMAVYLSGIFMYEEKHRAFEQAYRETGKRFDAGKSCVRFRTLENLPLDLIGKTIASIPMADFVAQVKKIHSSRKS